MTPDVNVLVAASRSDHAHHRVARRWLEGALDEAAHGGRFLLMPMVLASFLRLVTHPKIFVSPTPTAAAVAFLDALVDSPGVEVAALAEEWAELRALCLAKSLRANDLPDAWLAAAVKQHGETLATFDRDFRRLLSRSQVLVLEGQP